jgi:predicted PurR-regulated permease PerM
MANLGNDLTRTTLAILFIAALISGSIWILRPFLPATIWAVMLAIATWPLLRSLQSKLGGRRALAAAAITIAILIIFVMPFWLAIGTIVRHSAQIVGWTENLATTGLPPPPSWLESIPLVGSSAAHLWRDIANDDLPELLQKGRPYAGMITRWFIEAMGGLGAVFVQFLLTVAILAILYARGESAAAMARRFGARLAGTRGEEAVLLAGQAVRGVALGVVVTAFIQSGIGAFGLFLAGVPFASVFSAVMFMLCIAQVGPGLVLIPAVIWEFATGDVGWGVFLVAITIAAIAIDNFVRPVLIRRGVHLPLLVILSGVIGGLIAFGLIGIFLGPMILAVAYTLFRAVPPRNVVAGARSPAGGLRVGARFAAKPDRQ